MTEITRQRATTAARWRWGPKIPWCIACGKSTDGGRNRGYCSDACYRWAKRHPGQKRLLQRPCENCAAHFEPALATSRFCSRLCADLARGALTYGPKGGVIVCALCDQRKAVPVLGNTKSCLDCRAEWTVRTQVNWRAENPERVREFQRRRDQRRHAQRRGAAALVEDITASEVYGRDGWRCGLCGGQVPKTRSYPHPKSASLDHIVPLSLGGTHTLDNVQLAHLGCNLRKGVKAMNEQLLLVG